MKITPSKDIKTKTGLIFGKSGAGHVDLALQRAAETGKNILVVAFGAYDSVTGISVIDGQPLPLSDLAPVEKWEDLAELRTILLDPKSKKYDAIILLGVGAMADLVAEHHFPNGMKLQDWGYLGALITSQVRFMMQLAPTFYAVDDIRTEDEMSLDAEGKPVKLKAGALRFAAQPKVVNSLCALLSDKVYVASKSDGTRVIQDDPILALIFKAGK